MNALSWLIYGAEVLGKLNVVLGFLMAGSVFVLVVIWLGRIAIAVHLTSYDYPEARQPEGSQEYKSWQRWAAATKDKRFYVAPIAFALMASLIPSATTVYMIAASEAGEAVVTSDGAREIMGDLQEIIRNKLKDALGEDAPGFDA